MKSKRLLYLLVVLAVLVSASAIPALADDAIPMWIQRVRLAYTGRSPHGPDAMQAYIHVRDATRDMVAGASVTATWTWTLSGGGTGTETQTAVSNEQGIAIFSVWEGRGTYKICVDGVVKDGWAYDPDLNWEDCDELTPAP